MESLETLIHLLTTGRNLHISILDLVGVLESPSRQVSKKWRIHSKPFCTLAKTQSRGEELCFACKMRANQKAITYQKPFGGHCPWGIYEVALPILQEEKTIAVVYVGNYCIDPEISVAKLKRSSTLTQTPLEPLLNQLAHCEPLTDPKEPYRIARLVRDHLLSLPQENESRSSLHWLTKSLCNDADTYYRSRITLRQLARTYNRNEKYLGRLFKKEMGCSFHQYLLNCRLSAACNLLSTTDAKIIDIALECGFENISYFNRCFIKKYGHAPRVYRKQNQKFDILS